MIDIHSHFIPQIDDGFVKTEDAIVSLKGAVEMGVTDIVCTPHYRKPFMASYEKVNEAFETFKKNVEENGVQINLYLGREVFCGNDIKNLIETKNFSMPNGKYLLLEFSSFNSNDIGEVVYEFSLKGYIPIVAHIERYTNVSLEDAIDVKSSGGLIQVNADSIVGRNKRFYRTKIKDLLRNGLVDFVASDMHYGRINEMDRAYSFVKKKYSKEYADKIFIENAKDVIKS